jgi:hypothetical protein
VPLARVPTIAGYHPLVPAWVPKGYRLTEVAVSRKGSPTGPEGSNPVTGGVVSLSYRRGLDQFLVTTRLVGDDRSAWGDPLATERGSGIDQSGSEWRVAPSTGEWSACNRSSCGPHLWVITDDLVVTVSGDLIRTELVRVANWLG